MSALARLLPVRAQERRTVAVFGGALFINALATQISSVVALTGVVSDAGLPSLIGIWAIDMLIILAVTAAQSLILDRFPRLTLARISCFLFAFAFVLLHLLFMTSLPPWLTYGSLYMMAEQQWIFFPLVLWVLISDHFDMTQLKRLGPILVGAGLAGEAVGLNVTALIPYLFAEARPANLLALNVLLYLLTFAALQYGLASSTPSRRLAAAAPAADSFLEGWRFVFSVGAFRYLIVSVIATNIALTLLEYRFLSVAAASFPDAPAYQTFYSLYRLGLLVLAALLQGFLLSRLLAAVAIKNTFIALPLALLFSAGAMLISPGLLGVLLGMMLHKTTQLTIDESARKAVISLVPEERRGRVSALLESYLFALGTLLGALLLGALVWLAPRAGPSWESTLTSALAALCALIALLTAVGVRQVYDASLLNWRLTRRQRRASVLNDLDL